MSKVHVEITGPGGTVFNREVPDAILRLDHCVLELSGKATSWFAFFRSGTVECRTAEETRAFDVVGGCMSERNGHLSMVCQCATPCGCPSCHCGAPAPSAPSAPSAHHENHP